VTSLRQTLRRGHYTGAPDKPLTERILELLTPRQREFVLHPHRYKLARCSRRSGKTYMIAAYLLYVCHQRANMPVLYAGLTRDSAREAVWPILLDFLDRLDIPHTLHPSALQISFPNGSKVTIFGCDTENARNRLRGRKFALVCFDETGFYARLDPLVYAVLPMLADFKGTLCLTSSPGELLEGLFYEADLGKHRDSWAKWSWTIYDNPHFQQLADVQRPEQGIVSRADEELHTVLTLQFAGNAEHPGFKREWLGQWVANDTTLAYPVGESNLIPSPERLVDGEHAVGISFSPFVNAIVVGRYSSWSRGFQVIQAQQFDDLDLDAFAERLFRVMETFGAETIVAHTGAYSKDIVKELRRRYQLPIVAMDDKDRAFHQKVIANDLRAGHIKIVRGLPIIEQCSKIVKDATTGEEIEGQQNYMALAFLALYRRIYVTHLQSYQPPPSEEERHIHQLEQSRYSEEVLWYDRWPA
jgi:hypothetical protein